METKLDLAVKNLMKTLDNTPRAQWEPAVAVAVQAVKELGYAEGYRTGAMKVEIPAPAPQALPTLGHIAGEDKMLSETKSPDDAMEDLGWEFLREVARQMGRIAIMTDVTPGAVRLELVAIDAEAVRLCVNIQNPTLKGS